MIMDPLTASLAFATIVGLLSDFKSERNASSDDEYKDFVDWLSEKRHRSVVSKLNQSTKLAQSIRGLLADSHDDVVRRLENIDEILKDVASRIPAFSAIAAASSSSGYLSDDAVDILTQFVASKASFMVLSHGINSASLIIGDGKRGHISIANARFLEDDLKRLCEYGFMSADTNASGDRKWRITSLHYSPHGQAQ
jgi:hypothetical protein